jgi:hypothetical protein
MAKVVTATPFTALLFFILDLQSANREKEGPGRSTPHPIQIEVEDTEVCAALPIRDYPGDFVLLVPDHLTANVEECGYDDSSRKCGTRFDVVEPSFPILH